MPTVQEFFDLVEARDGHFRMESGLHARRWLELDRLFDNPSRLEPFIHPLTLLLKDFTPDTVCGPQDGGARLAAFLAPALNCGALAAHRLPDQGDGLYAARYGLGDNRPMRGKRVVVVDDVISAGSSVRATVAALQDQGAAVAAVGALVLLGTAAQSFFTPRGIATVAHLRGDIEMWPPQECPLCRSGAPLEQRA